MGDVTSRGSNPTIRADTSGSYKVFEQLPVGKMAPLRSSTVCPLDDAGVRRRTPSYISIATVTSLVTRVSQCLVGGLGSGATAWGVLGPITGLESLVELQVGWAEVVSGELSGDTGVVTMATVVNISVFAVSHGGAVLHNTAGRGDGLDIVAFASVLVVSHVHVTVDDADGAAAAHRV